MSTYQAFGTRGFRKVGYSDSLVTVCSWSKGRSSSFALSGPLRRGTAHQVAGRVSLAHLRCRSGDNPADDPSRFVKLRAPGPMPAWLRHLAEPAPLPDVSKYYQHRLPQQRLGYELF